VSTHEVKVYRIAEIEPHPNAHSLGLVRIEGFTAIVRLGDFKPGDLAAYIEPDYVVPDTEQFAFLQGKLRIRCKRLRGTWSQGLLIHAPSGAREGECVMERLGVTRYEPPMVGVRGPRGAGGLLGNDGTERPHASLTGLSAYDLENWRKHKNTLTPGERVYITEKLHGCNGRFSYRAGRMWVGSRNQWKRSGELTAVQRFLARVRRALVTVLPIIRRLWRPYPDLRAGNVWWRALKTNPWIEAFCRANQDCVLYGEVFGSVQDLKYGAKDGEVFFRAFDVLRGTKWVDAEEFARMLPAEHRVPVLFEGEYCPVKTEELSRLEKSTLADHLAEGIVIKPAAERWCDRVGRVALKLVSDRYLERAP
jgi:RNA ligase (TIGR02306 family)